MTPCCDVSSAAQLQAALDECRESGGTPPVKGCINLAMVLQDAVFENMTYEQWSTTIRSKVQTSWNLHNLLPKDMSFFILMSSLVGIYGTASQSNYAAGNTFQDALARYRTQLAETASCTSVSLDLGWMRSIGIVAERAFYRQGGETIRDMVPVQTEDLLAVLEHYCDPSVTITTTAATATATATTAAAPAIDSLSSGPGGERHQLLIGINTPADFHSTGKRSPPSYLLRPLYAPFDMARSANTINSTNTSTAGRQADQQQEERESLQRLKQTLRDASSYTREQRGAAVVGALTKKLSRSLGIAAAESIDPGKGLSEYGVDSLMAVELRNWFWRDFAVSVAVFEIMDAPDIQRVGLLVADKAEGGTRAEGKE